MSIVEQEAAGGLLAPNTLGTECQTAELSHRAMPEYDCAIESRAVSIMHLIEANRMSVLEVDPVTRIAFGRYVPLLETAYAQENGRILDSYYCRAIPGASVLTEHTETGPARGDHIQLSLHFRYPHDLIAGITADFEDVLARCSAIAKESGQLLRTQNNRLVHIRTQSVVVYLLSVLDTLGNYKGEERKARIRKAVGRANSELREIESLVRSCARWNAQFAYSGGMMAGLLGLIALGTAIAGLVFLFTGQMSQPQLHGVLVCLVAGGMGAVLSVMTRLGSQRMTLNNVAEHKLLVLLGGFRPLVGAALGGALNLFVFGGFLNMATPEKVSILYFIGALAFLAGFNERFAQAAFSGAALKAVGASAEKPLKAKVGPQQSSERGHAGTALAPVV